MKKIKHSVEHLDTVEERYLCPFCGEEETTAKPWIVSQDSFNYGFGMMAVCPDCHRTVFIIGDELEDVEEYNFCPICGRQRYKDEK